MQMKEKNAGKNPRGMNASEFWLINNQQGTPDPAKMHLLCK